ncbi:hypothetical protein, partial [Bilophila wadsworthia]|uniref:hypothetical protein n=1 Tax=Bilophila wadsworthia TaxID=35833 RepID=UPI00242BFAA0
MSLEKKVLFLNQKIASRKAVNRDSINIKVLGDGGGGVWGGGGRSPCSEGVVLPHPQLIFVSYGSISSGTR